MIKARIRDLLCRARDGARRQGIKAEFLLHREHSSLIRLGNSAVGLSTYEDLTRLDVSVTEGWRTGSFGLTANIVSDEQLADALRIADENCRAALPRDYDPIFGAVEAPVDDERGMDPALENLSPVAKTALCARVVRALKPRGDYDFSGSWSSGSTEIYYITTANDLEAYRRLTDGRLVMVLKDQRRKWELSVEQGGKNVAAFSADTMIAEFEALLPIYESNEGYRTELGHQRVMFGPQAIASLTGLALWSGLSGRGWEEKRSFTAHNQPGDKLFSDSVTIVDDPNDPNVFGMPFDYYGVLRRRFPLVEKGIFRGLMYDANTAAKYKKPQTGHTLDTNDMVFAPGDAPAGIDAGRKLAGNALYIPHLHYINMPDASQGLFTGSSRFNAQRIADGEFVAPLLSSRVTDTVPNVLSHVVAISSHARLFDDSSTYGRRAPDAVSVPDYMICDNVRISDVADSF